MKVMLAGDVETRLGALRPASREIDRINSLKPVERRLKRWPGTFSSSVLCRTEPPNSLLKIPGATASIVWAERRYHQSFRAGRSGRGLAGGGEVGREGDEDDHEALCAQRPVEGSHWLLELLGLQKRSLCRAGGHGGCCRPRGSRRVRVHLPAGFRLLDVNRSEERRV